MTPEQKKTAGKVGLILAVVAIAGIIVGAVMGAFRKKYTFDWAGGNKVAAKGDDKWYAGLHIITKGGNTSLKVGDYVNIVCPSAPGLEGRHKIIQLGSDDNAYDGKAMVVVDIQKDKPGLDTVLDEKTVGTIKKA